MNRRNFLGLASLSSVGICVSNGKPSTSEGIVESEFNLLSQRMLKTWCDGMLEHQINEPSNPKIHGMLKCPACDIVHGRCWESIYPFLRMARTTGEQRYLDAAIRAFEWSSNVSYPDGRWTNDLEADSWAGITVFGAIALAESIYYHGDLLPPRLLAKWKKRLHLAMEGYIEKTFSKISYGNVNYGMISLYAFNFIGRVLGEEKYIVHSRLMAKEVRAYFTDSGKFIFGEGKPKDERSEKGLLKIDLGYNVEESLNGLVLYALEERDTELLEILTVSMNSHLEFMLPDGGWDNSWGTRQAKWSYWGSRTSDGCQPGFSMMADRNPAFGTAAYKNLELLEQCTADGLLHGGLHYISHGVKPCIHHTFCHAKALAFLQDHKSSLAGIDKSTPLPRTVADGVKSVVDLDVLLAARGPWRGTVSAYDALYTDAQKKHIQQATGGTLAVLYHDKVGLLFAASMADYTMVEANNMQPQPGEDFALTPRIEKISDGVVYSNLYDLGASPKALDNGSDIRIDVPISLLDMNYNKLEGDVADYRISYLINSQTVTIEAEAASGADSNKKATMILPVISKTSDRIKRVGKRRIEIQKNDGVVFIESSEPLKIKASEKDRIFNMVPGLECLPILIEIPVGVKVSCSLSVE